MSEPPERDRALAHYLWPPQWVGEAPAWADGPIPQDVSELADLIVEADVGEGVQARVFRDGEVVFALGLKQAIPGVRGRFTGRDRPGEASTRL